MPVVSSPLPLVAKASALHNTRHGVHMQLEAVKPGATLISTIPLEGIS